MSVVTRVYDTHAHAQTVVNELEKAGVSASEISLVANKHVSDQYDNVDDASATGTGAGLGAAVGGGAGLLAGLGLMAIPGLGPVVAAGWLVSTAVGAVAGAATGGIIGALVGEGVSESDAHVYAESVRRGSTMVTVRAPDADHRRIEAIMDRYSPVDPAVRGEEYRRSGWNQFDPSAPAYRPTDEELRRIRGSGI